MTNEQTAITTETILTKAGELGELIAQHAATQSFHEAAKAVEEDQAAQRLLTDYNRHMQSVAEKEASGAAIEVDDKHKLKELQQQVAMSSTLGRLQVAQMDYLDLMRKVEASLAGNPGPA